jgi:hypothetical protein
MSVAPGVQSFWYMVCKDGLDKVPHAEGVFAKCLCLPFRHEVESTSFPLESGLTCDLL